jgi:GNAT superfamily N-acetyltransferase
MAQPITLTIDNAPNPDDMTLVRQKLAEFNCLHAPDDNHQSLTIFLRTEDGTLVGGLLGDTYWGWLSVSILWVDERLRGQGWGQNLLAAAEVEAVRRGCRHAHLDTMDFQARAFYEKRGYTLFGQLDDLPAGHSRYFMQKPLESL